MKKIVSLILVLALSVYLPCSVSAAANSPGNDAPATGDTTTVGIWLVIMVLALAAIVVSTVFYRKSLKKNVE